MSVKSLRPSSKEGTFWKLTIRLVHLEQRKNLLWSSLIMIKELWDVLAVKARMSMTLFGSGWRRVSHMNAQYAHSTLCWKWLALVDLLMDMEMTKMIIITETLNTVGNFAVRRKTSSGERMMDLVIFFRITEIIIHFACFSNGYVSVSVALATLEAVSLGFWGSKTSACLPLEIDSLFLTELKIIGGTLFVFKFEDLHSLSLKAIRYSLERLLVTFLS